MSQLRPQIRLDSKHRARFQKILLERLEHRYLMAGDSSDFVGPAQFVAHTSPDQVWSTTPGLPIVEGKQAYIQPVSYIPVALNQDRLRAALDVAPLEFTEAASASTVEITLPKPDGSFARFKIASSPIMAPELAAQFPEIQTFSGQGIDDPAAALRFDMTPAGFHAQVLSPSGAYYIDPFWHLDTSAYISYFKRDLPRPADLVFVEEGLYHDHDHDHDHEHEHEREPKGSAATGNSDDMENSDNEPWQLSKDPGSPTLQRSGAQLRVYDLANAATGEYTAFHGGTVALGQAAIVTAVNRVTGIYENELSVRLVLVANNSALVYTNASTDPYTNGNGGALLAENQSNIDTIIGSANYDIGHVFSTGGGGLAGLGVVGVNGQKARGQTGTNAPIGDPFYVDYVAHEVGHQFGGNHTFNSPTGSCAGNRAAGAAYEPGSGSTIQAYAGICGADNLQPNSDPYFHSVSFDEIIRYISSGAGDTSATKINTGNSVPTVSAGLDYVIPAQTPFVLKAAGSDSNSTDVLTYNWEQRDLGASTTLAAADNGSSPIFRSFNPTVSSERTFPRLAELLNNTVPVGERLPTVNRAMDFRVTVRDNRAGGGGVNTDDMLVTVVNTGSAFSVTSPNTATTWAAGSTQTITWDVAGTNAAPINTAAVNIWLSTNGGLTFTHLLATGVANDGSQDIVVPDLTTSQARIRVEAANNIYFDLSNTNFNITGGTNTAPTVSSITNRNLQANTNTGSLAFTVGDAQTAAADLTVTATSSNPTLLPNSRITLGGSGANRTLLATPHLGQYGGTTVYIHVTDAAGLTTTTSFQIYVAEVIACTSIESFDGVTAPALPAGWTTTATGSAATNWITSATNSDSGTNNAFISNPSNISDSQLTSPAITITNANRTFQFRHNYNLETGYDGGVLEVSVGGGPFADLLTAGGSFLNGGYTSTLDTGYSNPIGGRSAWSGTSSGYITTTVQLPASMLGQSVRLRFRMGSDNGVNAVGWRVDTIQYCGVFTPSVLSITAIDSSKNEGNSGTTPFSFVVNRYNETTGATTVQYAVTGSGSPAASANDFGGTLPSGTVNFAAGETSKTVVIDVTGDTEVESNEGFLVTLSNASGGALLETATANSLILNDDANNTAPTDIGLSQNSVTENSPLGSTVGNLSTVDSDVGNTFTYTLVSGSGDADNGGFTIVGNALRTATTLNFESKPTYSVRIRTTDQGGLNFEKSFTLNVIDLAEFSTPVVLGDGTAQRSSVKQLVITFDGNVEIASGAFVVDKLGAGGGAVTTNATTTLNGAGQTVVTLQFSGSLTRGTSNALSDGYYRLTVDGSKITRGGQPLDTNGDGIGGDTYTLGSVEADNFFARYGDTNGDGLVGIAEFGQFRSSFGKLSTDVGYDVRFEFDGDGAVGISDFGQFRSRFGQPKMPF